MSSWVTRQNVADLARPPTQRSAASHGAREKVWTTEQLRSFLTATADDRLAPMWQLMTTTGLRRGETIELRWLDVDLERARLRATGTVTEVRGNASSNRMAGPTRRNDRCRSMPGPAKPSSVGGCASRRAALLHLAAEVPAAVLAELLGYSNQSATTWTHDAGGSWSRYAAGLAHERIQPPAE